MKKVIAMLLVLTLMISLSLNAFAATANIGQANGTSSQVVKGTYKTQATKTVYSVDIVWSDMSFTYTEQYEGEWNAVTHKYENATEGGWTGTGTITITNHSNTAITADASYKANAGYESAGMSFDKDPLTLATADNGVNGAAGTATEGRITVTPTGTLPEGTQNAEIGTITITIS